MARYEPDPRQWRRFEPRLLSPSESFVWPDDLTRPDERFGDVLDFCAHRGAVPTFRATSWSLSQRQRGAHWNGLSHAARILTTLGLVRSHSDRLKKMGSRYSEAWPAAHDNPDRYNSTPCRRLVDTGSECQTSGCLSIREQAGPKRETDAGTEFTAQVSPDHEGSSTRSLGFRAVPPTHRNRPPAHARRHAPLSTGGRERTHKETIEP